MGVAPKIGRLTAIYGGELTGMMVHKKSKKE